MVLLVLRLLAVVVSNDPLLLLPDVSTRNFSLQEVYPRLHFRNELQLKVPNTKVPPGMRSMTSLTTADIKKDGLR